MIVGSNALAVDAAAAEARRLGFHTLVLSTFVEGEAREVARVHAAIAKEIRASGTTGSEAGLRDLGRRNHGDRSRQRTRRPQSGIRAGRRDRHRRLTRTSLILSAGTDGTDGPTDAAGAIADGTTLARAQALGLNAAAFLANNDSYHFFEATGDLIKTGPTGTNVADIQLILVADVGRSRGPQPTPSSATY